MRRSHALVAAKQRLVRQMIAKTLGAAARGGRVSALGSGRAIA